MGVLTSEDLRTLTNKDLHEIFSIIHLANCHLKLPEMRTRIAKSLKQAFQAKGVVFLLADKEFRTIDNTSLIGAGVDLHYMDSMGSPLLPSRSLSAGRTLKEYRV